MRARVRIIAALLSVAAARAASPAAPVFPIPPAAIDDRLEVTGETVAARQIRSRMTVGVMIGVKGPFRFLVDSGADRSVIGSDLARQLALPPGPTVTVNTISGSSTVTTVRLEQLAIGRSVTHDILAPALPESFLGAQGILGIDALAQQRVMLDFEKRTITLQDNGVAERPVANGDEVVVVARRRKGQLILTQASVGRQPVAAVVDSGAEVTIGNHALQQALFRGRTPPPSTPIVLVSVTGQKVLASGVLMPEVRLGGVTLRGVEIAFVDVPPFALFGLSRQPAILLGTDVLEAFRRVSLDFRHRRIRFVLRR